MLRKGLVYLKVNSAVAGQGGVKEGWQSDVLSKPHSQREAETHP